MSIAMPQELLGGRLDMMTLAPLGNVGSFDNASRNQGTTGRWH